MPDWNCGLTAVTEPGQWAVLLSTGHGLDTAVKALLQAVYYVSKTLVNRANDMSVGPTG